MPQIRLRGLNAEQACNGSGELLERLATELEAPLDYFTIEVVHSSFIRDGAFAAGYPFVEVLWFDRGAEAQDRVAVLITDWVRAMGVDSVDVWFTPLRRRDYYENGEHFG